MGVLSNLQPSSVFNFFEEMANIPHGSGNEKEISDYLVKFAKDRNIEVIQDKALNVIMRKPATKGYENAPMVTIQGHMDMVCEKNQDTVHDFEKDPLKLRIEGDKIFATGTTLGADNAIAVAYGLAIFDSNDLEHPAIELLVTTNEEVGMDGVIELDPKDIKGKILLNADSEEEGIFLVSCAGGLTNNNFLKAEYIEGVGATLKIEIRGLNGGHSGMEIIKQRANSNKLMGRLLDEIRKEVEFNVASFNGGSKPNAIPRECDVVLTVSQEEIEKVKSIASRVLETFKNEFKVQDKNITIEVKEVEKVAKVFTKEVTDKLINFVTLVPNGIQTMSKEIENLVESSLNLGVAETSEDGVKFIFAVRSSVRSLKYEIMDRIKNLDAILGMDFEIEAEYPEWQYDSNSKIKDIAISTYKEITGKEAKIDAIHAGLECGLLKEKLPDMDMISFGPNISGAHTPQENMSISSVARCYDFLVALLKNIK